MQQSFETLVLETNGPGLVEITDRVLRWCSAQEVDHGLLTLFVRHTSASLVIQENADPDVCRDLQDFFANLAPQDRARYRHGAEGPDDMPAHIRSALTQTSLSIPVAEGRPGLGTWQGIYLFEHRDRPHRRSISMHLFGQ